MTDFTITGRLASFGRGGMIKDISNRLLRDFAACLQQQLAAEPAGGLTGEEAAASAGARAGAGGARGAGRGRGGREARGKTPPPPRAPAAARPPPPPPSAPPVKGFSLVLSVLWERIRGLFRRG